MRWRSVKFFPAKRAQCSRSGAKFIHTHSVRTPAWFITWSSTRRHCESHSSYSAEAYPETIT